jgi:hypothetical protein
MARAFSFLTVIAAIAFAQQPATAAPTWLACTYSDGSGLFKIGIDTSSSTIQYIGRQPNPGEKENINITSKVYFHQATFNLTSQTVTGSVTTK